MDFSSVSGLVNSATTTVQSVSNAVNMISSGPISALGSLGGGIQSILGNVSNFLKPLSGVSLPIKNPLFNYASYTYVLGLGCLSDYELNHPDTTYQKGNIKNLIAKSANIDPNNRVNTVYGKADFFIDNLEMRSQIGFDGILGNTNVQNFTFTITEPYSMGMFVIACQQLAQSLGHNNWREAPFILTIDFRGNREGGQLDLIKGCSRRIPFSFTNMSMKVTEQGATYQCEAMAWVQSALLDEKTLFKSDAAVRGRTVQEILQTGENSLQATLNKRQQELVRTGAIAVADQYVILFPIDTSSQSGATAGSETENTTGATTTTVDSAQEQDIYKQLGVSRSSVTSLLVQQFDQCNAIGQASLGFDADRRGDTSPPNESDIYDAKTNTFNLGSIKIDPKETEMRFGQDSSIPAAINQVLLMSDYSKAALDPSNLTSEGYRQWWRIDTQVFNISSDANMTLTGTKPKIIVYRVVPYNVHSSRMMPPNTKAPGFSNLKKQAVKEYNYIYTGKNVDILKFEIDIKNGFTTIMGADALALTQDKVTAGANSASDSPNENVQPMPPGNAPSTAPGSAPSTVKYINTLTKSDRGGGGGQETQVTRAARLFQDALSVGTDLYNLDLTIIGDPYYIMQSGVGNYTSSQSQYANLNADGTMNYQNGEVDIMVSFRTPIDINQATGLYSFSQSSRTAPVLAYSGLYCVQEVVSSFKGGQFTQNLKGFRRPQQEGLFEAEPSQLFNPTRTTKPADPGGETE